ncbi:MAG: thrombospondin type 3 repeat-containing protein, partial [candidate division Zixibacteria bacterium]|nr:thrombospondin type 3 repeat-containing protein [candidate division Zixibacteria bacterium]
MYNADSEFRLVHWPAREGVMKSLHIRILSCVTVLVAVFLITPALALAVEGDWDDDGIDDSLDNCPYMANPNQLDSDGDGIGDGCFQGIRIDRVVGLTPSGGVRAGTPITFDIRMTNEKADCYNVINGYRIWSPEGIPFTAVQGTRLQPWWDIGWPESFNQHFEWDGASYVPAAAGIGGPAVGSDVALSLSGVNFFGGCSMHLPEWFDDVAYNITIEPIDHQYAGGTICIDSTYTPPGNQWKWASAVGGPDVFPSWDGPHCYEVVS